jgi:hypothetical protein
MFIPVMIAGGQAFVYKKFSHSHYPKQFMILIRPNE